MNMCFGWRTWCFGWRILLIDMVYVVFWLAYSFDGDGVCGVLVGALGVLVGAFLYRDGVLGVFVIGVVYLLHEVEHLVSGMVYLVTPYYGIFRICIFFLLLENPCSKQSLSRLCGKKSAGLKKVHHRRLWRL